MRTRKLDLGTKNIVGQALHDIRKSQNLKVKQVKQLLTDAGISITDSAISKIEGGHRVVYDYELLAFSVIYNTPIDAIYKIKGDHS